MNRISDMEHIIKLAIIAIFVEGPSVKSTQITSGDIMVMIVLKWRSFICHNPWHKSPLSLINRVIDSRIHSKSMVPEIAARVRPPMVHAEKFVNGPKYG